MPHLNYPRFVSTSRVHKLRSRTNFQAQQSKRLQTLARPLPADSAPKQSETVSKNSRDPSCDPRSLFLHNLRSNLILLLGLSEMLDFTIHTPWSTLMKTSWPQRSSHCWYLHVNSKTFYPLLRSSGSQSLFSATRQHPFLTLSFVDRMVVPWIDNLPIPQTSYSLTYPIVLSHYGLSRAQT